MFNFRSVCLGAVDDNMIVNTKKYNYNEDKRYISYPKTLLLFRSSVDQSINPSQSIAHQSRSTLYYLYIH